jgi:hypothetical protein
MAAALLLSSVVGVNVHSLDPKPVQRYAAAGFRAVRFDMPWLSVQWHDGDHWEQFDPFFAELAKYGMAPVVTIHGSLRPDGYAPADRAERVAFAHFAQRAARRYRAVTWEVWNEPNVPGFWLPAPDAAAYTDLLALVSVAIRAEDPSARVIGPSLGGGTLDWAFLADFLRHGGLEYIDALAVHPYGVGAPEAAADYYAHLRRVTQGKVPIVVSEWGFSNPNEVELGYLIARGLIVNEDSGIGLSIVYEWQDSPGGGANTPHMGLCHPDGTPKRALGIVSSYLRRTGQ